MRKAKKKLVLIFITALILSITLNGCKAYQRSNPSPKQLPVEEQITIVFITVLFIVITIYFIIKGLNDYGGGDSESKKRNKRKMCINDFWSGRIPTCNAGFIRCDGEKCPRYHPTFPPGHTKEEAVEAD